MHVHVRESIDFSTLFNWCKLYIVVLLSLSLLDERHAKTFAIVSVSVLCTLIRFCYRFNVLLMVFVLVLPLNVIRDQNQVHFYLFNFTAIEVNSIYSQKPYWCRAFVPFECYFWAMCRGDWEFRRNPVSTNKRCETMMKWNIFAFKL